MTRSQRDGVTRCAFGGALRRFRQRWNVIANAVLLSGAFGVVGGLSLFLQTAFAETDAVSALDDEVSVADVWTKMLTGRERLGAVSGHVVLEVSRTLVEGGATTEQLNGSRLRAEFYFDPKRNLMRVDFAEDRPKNPQDAWDARFSFSNGTFRIIDSYKRKKLAVHELAGSPEAVRGGKLGTVQNLWIDLRVIGCTARSFERLRRLRLESLREMLTKAMRSDVSAVELKGRRMAKVRLYFGDGDETTKEFVLDPDLDWTPVSLEERFVYRHDNGTLVDRLECEWASHPSRGLEEEPVWFPKTVVYRRWNRDILVAHEVWNTAQVTLEGPPSENLFTWQGLGLWPGAVVIRGEHPNREIVEWDGSEYRPWKPVPLVPALQESVEDASYSSSVWRTWFAVLNVVAGVAVIATIVINRLRRTKGKRNA